MVILVVTKLTSNIKLIGLRVLRQACEDEVLRETPDQQSRQR
jgi:hypothetical protein